MSHAPSTCGTITTSSRSPMAATSCIRSSSIQGLSSALMRVQSCVSPSCISEPTRISPSRAASLRSTGMASSRLPSRMSTCGAMSGAFATIFSFEKSRKWIIREGLKGISRSGSGASMASGLKKSLGLHINDVYAAESQQGRNVVVGPLVYSLALGMSVADVSGKAIANLATEELSHPAPVFHGDTLFAESEVLEVKPSSSKPDRGVVRVHTRVYKQDGTLVAEFKRAVLVPRLPGAGSE